MPHLEREPSFDDYMHRRWRRRQPRDNESEVPRETLRRFFENYPALLLAIAENLSGEKNTTTPLDSSLSLPQNDSRIATFIDQFLTHPTDTPPLKKLCQVTGLDENNLIRELIALPEEEVVYLETHLDDAMIAACHLFCVNHRSNDFRDLIHLLTNAHEPSHSLFRDVYEIAHDDGIISLTQLEDLKKITSSLQTTRFIQVLEPFFHILKNPQLKAWLATTPLQTGEEEEIFDLWRKLDSLMLPYGEQTFTTFLKDPRAPQALTHLSPQFIIDISHKISLETITFDELLRYPEFIVYSVEKMSEAKALSTWGQRLDFIQRVADTLGLGGTTKTEVDAALVYRHAHSLSDIYPNFLATFKEWPLSEKAKFIDQLRANLTVNALQAYVAFVKRNRTIITQLIDTWELEKLPPSGIELEPTIWEYSHFDQLENRPWLGHLIPLIGFEREFAQPSSWRSFLSEHIMPFLQVADIQVGGGGTKSVEWSPGPFASWQTAYAVFAQLENNNLTNFTGGRGNSLHLNREVRSKTLSLVTEIMIELAGYARLPEGTSLGTRNSSEVAQNRRRKKWIESKRPNHTHHYGTMMLLKSHFLLGSAQKAYEKALVYYEKPNSWEITHSVVNHYNQTLHTYTDQELRDAHLTPEEMELAKLYRELLQVALEVMQQADLMTVFGSFGLTTFGHDNSTYVRRLISEIFPNVYSFLDENRLETTSRITSSIAVGHDIYPNVVAACRDQIERFCSEVEDIHANVYDTFLIELKKLQILLRSNMSAQNSEEVATALVYFFTRFPYGYENLEESAYSAALTLISEYEDELDQLTGANFYDTAQ